MFPGLKANNVTINLGDRGFNDVTQLREADGIKSGPANANGVAYVMPFRMKLEGDKEFYILPQEPLVSVSGGNIIARRNVAKGKGRGSIKERWTQDDYSITVEGLFMLSSEDAYPEEDVQKLRGFCEAAEAIEVECELLKHLNITRMVIEKFDFPFTKGENVQRYSFSGYSDDITDLLVEEN